MPYEKALVIARTYIGSGDILKDLGAGAEGFVFASPTSTAIKIFQTPEKFEHELAAYLRLREHEVIDVSGFAVPRLIASDAHLLVIEMTMVEPPFILDFAQSTLDEPRDFPEGHIEEWWERVADDFGERFDVVQALFYELQYRYGIYYYDLAPRNVNFGDTV